MAASAVDLNQVQAITSFCGACNAPNPKSKCGACKQIQYCGRECQVQAWKAHKPACQVFQQYRDAIVLPPNVSGPIDATLIEEDERKPLTQELFQKMTGGYRYSSKAVLTPETILSARENNNLLFLNDIQPVQSKFKINPNAVAVQNHPVFGLSLIALTPFKKHQGICYFGGEIVPHSNKYSYRKSQYVVSDLAKILSADTYMGAGLFANDGFPNAIFTPDNYGQSILTSLTNINSGEAIYVDYGAKHGVKTGMYYIDPSSYAMIVAFCQNTFAQTIQKMTPENLALEGHDDADIARMRFIFATPPVLVNLLLDGVISFKNADKYLQKMNRSGVNATFSHLYPKLLQAVRNIVRAGPDVIAATKTLMNEVTISAFMTLIPHYLSSGNEPVSVALLKELTVAGKLIDQVYLITNGTTRGTYLDATDPFPTVAIDEPAFIEQYRQLLRPRQECILAMIDRCIGKLKTQQLKLAVGQENPIQQLERLLNSCR